jgi:hypothetical protein
MARKTAEPTFYAADCIQGSSAHLESFPNWRRPLIIWVFVADMTNEFILGLNILRAYAASVDIERQTLRLAEEYILWRSPEAGPPPSNIRVEENQTVPVLCKETVMARLKRPLGVGNCMIEPSPKTHPREGMYIARTLFKACKTVPVRV